MFSRTQGAMRGAFETCKYSMMDDDLFLFLMIIEKTDVSGFLNNGAGLTSKIPWTLGYQRFTGAAVKHRLKDHVLPVYVPKEKVRIHFLCSSNSGSHQKGIRNLHASTRWWTICCSPFWQAVDGGELQTSNLQWVLTAVPVLKSLVLGLSFIFWYVSWSVQSLKVLLHRAFFFFLFFFSPSFGVQWGRTVSMATRMCHLNSFPCSVGDDEVTFFCSWQYFSLLRQKGSRGKKTASRFNAG